MKILATFFVCIVLIGVGVESVVLANHLPRRANSYEMYQAQFRGGRGWSWGRKKQSKPKQQVIKFLAPKITYPRKDGNGQVSAYFCLPKGTGSFPAVIYNHGGRDNQIGGAPDATCQALAEAGFIGLAPLYTPNIAWSGYIGDIISAINYLRKHPQVDSSRLAIMGFSRGGAATLETSVFRPDDFKAIVLMAPAPGEDNSLANHLPYVNKISALILTQVAEDDRAAPADHLSLAKITNQAFQAAGKNSRLIIYPAGNGGHQMFFTLGGYWKDTVAFLQDALSIAPVKATAAGSNIVHNKLKELKQEVAGFRKHRIPGPEHYHRIKKDLTWLAEQGAPAEELVAIRQSLESWDPEKMAQAVEASRQEARTKQAEKGQQAGRQDSGQSISQQGGGPPSSPGCVSNPNPIFTHDITDLSRISQINKPVMLQNSGAVKSHSYLWINGGGEVPVYAPVDSRLVAVSYYEDDYGLSFEVGCGELRWRLGHITNPVASIRAVLPSHPQSNSRDIYIAPISFKAGDLVAYTSGTQQAHNWDFGVYDPNRTNELSLSQSGVGEKDTIARCPYDYYSPEKKAQYYSLFQSPPNAAILLDLCQS